MDYRIIAFHDTIGEDDTYLTDAVTDTLSDEIVDTLEQARDRIRQIIDEGKANNIEVIYPCGNGNRHISLCEKTHPFAQVEHTFEELDLWYEDEKQYHTAKTIASITPDTPICIITDDNNDLPF